VLEQVYASRTQQLANPHKLVEALLGLCGDMSQTLESIPTEKFAKGWLLHALATELLKYSIEDDYINLEDMRPDASAAFRDLLESDDWINLKLERFLEVCRKVAEKQAIPAQQVRIRIPTRSGNRQVTGWIAERDQPPIPVSSEYFPFVSLLEDSIVDPSLVRGIVEAFTERLVQLQEKEKISCLCFVEKGAGPIGAVSMLATLVGALNLPACIYRENYWAKRAKLVGYQPTISDRIALVYDLVVTGNGIRQVAKELKTKYDATVVAAVVLFGYDMSRKELESNDQTIKVESIGWYQNLASQVEEIRTKEVGETPDIIKVVSSLVANPRSIASTPRVAGGIEDAPPLQGGKSNMSPSPSHRWNRSLSTYPKAELRVLRFRSVKEIDRAIDLCWQDPNLIGVPRSIADGKTLIVPQDAVQYFSAKGLKFTVSTLLNREELTTEELADMRRKFGM
jgi:orotate phosphoribosyltransferase